MDYQEFLKKREILENGVKRVQFKFVVLPVLFGIATVNIFTNGTTEYMFTAAIITALVIGVPLQLYVSRKIVSTAKEMGFHCSECDKTINIKTTQEIATTGKCPNCGSQFLNKE